MNRLAVTVAFVAAFTAASFSFTSSGQSEQLNAEAEPHLRLITLSFKGGTTAEYVAALRKATSALNVVVHPDAADVQLPPIELINVSAAGAIEILHGHRMSTNGRVVELQYGEVVPPAGGRIFTVRAITEGRSAAITRVWSIAGILSHEIAAEDLLTAIQTALDLEQGTPTAAELRFHKATGVLIARATIDQLSVIDQTIRVIEHATHEKHAANTSSDREDALKTIEHLQGRIRQLEDELSRSKRP